MTLTKDIIQIRCTECPECGTRWSWSATLQDNSTPVMKWKNKTVYPRRALIEIRDGKPVPDDRVAVTTCENPLCCNPDLLRSITRADARRRTAKTGAFSTPASRAKCAATKRAKSKLSQEAVAEIRISPEPAKALAEKYGISTAYVNMLRRNRFRKDYIGNPFLGLLA